MDNRQYVEEIAGLYKKAIGIVLERSKKYASEDDPFLNFRRSAAFAGTTVTQGIMTRLGDKLSRLQNTIDRAEVGDEYFDESFEDTIVDLCNYFVILRNWRIVEREETLLAQQQMSLFDAEDEAGEGALEDNQPGIVGRTIGKLVAKLSGIQVE